VTDKDDEYIEPAVVEEEPEVAEEPEEEADTIKVQEVLEDVGELPDPEDRIEVDEISSSYVEPEPVDVGPKGESVVLDDTEPYEEDEVKEGEGLASNLLSKLPDNDWLPIFNLWWPVFVAVPLTLFLFYIHLKPSLYESFGAGMALQTWTTVIILAMGILVFFSGMRYLSLGAEEEEAEEIPTTESGQEQDSDNVVVEDVEVQRADTIEYPEKISGGIYGDVAIWIDEDKKLLVRTMLARLCRLCKEQQDCWKTIEDTASWDSFLTNIHCREGLAKMSGLEIENDGAVLPAVIE